jgi:hypothetical protein
MTGAFGAAKGLGMCRESLGAMEFLEETIRSTCDIIRLHFIPSVHGQVDPGIYSGLHVLLACTFSSMMWMLTLLKQTFSERESDREASAVISGCSNGLGNAISEYMGPYATWFTSAVGSRGLNTDTDVTEFLGTLEKRDEVVELIDVCINLSDRLKTVGLEMDSRIGGPQVFLIQ